MREERFDGDCPLNLSFGLQILDQSHEAGTDQLLEQQLLHHLKARYLAAVETEYSVIDDLDRARHLEADHAAFDAIKQGG